MIATARKDYSIMARSIAALLALGVAVTASQASAQSARGPIHRGLDSINQPVVVRSDLTLDLASRGNGLSQSERGRLAAWFDSLGLGYGDRVSVDDPLHSDGTRLDIARVAADYGLLLHYAAPVTAGRVEPGSVRVVVSRSTASVPSCPHWQGRGGVNSTSPNYGCAINSNLAAMIADPSDLVLGQAGSGTGDAATAAKAIKVYRDTAPSGSKGLTETSSQSSGGN
jgi:pilus assembly protein CpaD